MPSVMYMLPSIPRDHAYSLDPSPKRIPKLSARNQSTPAGISSTAYTTQIDTRFWTRPPKESLEQRSSSPAQSRSASIFAPSETAADRTKLFKRKFGVFGFLTLKEPSTSAWEEYTRQQKAQDVLKGSAVIPLSNKKLPAEVPKVNSKWDGMPNAAHHSRSSSKKTLPSPTPSSDLKRSMEWSVGNPPPTAASSGSNRRANRTGSREHPPPDSTPGIAMNAFGADRRPSNARRTSGFKFHASPRMSTETLEPEDDGEDCEAIPEMALFWPPNYSFEEDQQAASGDQDFHISPTLPPQRVHSSSTALHTTTVSDASTPNMPLTPDSAESINYVIRLKSKAGPSSKAFRSLDKPYNHDARQWPLANDLASGRSSTSDALTPPLASPSFRRPSVESLLARRAASGNFTNPSPLDGAPARRSSEARPQLSSPKRPMTRSFSRPISPTEDSFSTSAWYSSEEEDDELKNVDISKHNASPRKAVSLANFKAYEKSYAAPRIITDPRHSSESASPPSIVRPSSASAVYSFSRPLPLASSHPVNSASSSSPMGTVSIIRYNRPTYNNSNSTYTPTSTLHVPPRFQPGRVITKDSDLDTIAESITTSRRQSRMSNLSVQRDKDVDVDSIQEAIPRGIPLRFRATLSPPNQAETSTMRTSISFSDTEGEADGKADGEFGDDLESESEAGTTEIASAQDTLGNATNFEDSESVVDPRYQPDQEECEHALQFDHGLPRHRSAFNLRNRGGDTASIAESRISVASHMSEEWYKSPRERLGLGGFIRRSTKDAPWPEDTVTAAVEGPLPHIETSLPSPKFSLSLESPKFGFSGRRTPLPIQTSDDDTRDGGVGKETSTRRGLLGVLKKGIAR